MPWNICVCVPFYLPILQVQWLHGTCHWTFFQECFQPFSRLSLSIPNNLHPTENKGEKWNVNVNTYEFIDSYSLFVKIYERPKLRVNANGGRWVRMDAGIIRIFHWSPSALHRRVSCQILKSFLARIYIVVNGTRRTSESIKLKDGVEDKCLNF